MPSFLKRSFWLSDSVKNNGYPEPGVETYVPAPPEEANLVSSLTQNGGHAPVIDLDFPVYLVPSSTPGHYHLYIERELSWNTYRPILDAFYNAGLIEKAWYKNALARKASFVRPPWVPKPGTAAKMLKERKEKKKLRAKVKLEKLLNDFPNYFENPELQKQLQKIGIMPGNAELPAKLFKSFDEDAGNYWEGGCWDGGYYSWSGKALSLMGIEVPQDAPIGYKITIPNRLLKLNKTLIKNTYNPSF